MALEILEQDQGPHSSTADLQCYRSITKPTVAYTPRANGPVESLVRTAHPTLRSIMLELKSGPGA